MITVFGDSIAFGEFDSLGGYINRLKKDFEIINKSICGEDTKGLLLRLENNLKKTKPDKVIIALGINDSAIFMKKNNVSISDFEKNYKLIIKIIKTYTNKIICIGLTRVDETKTNPIPWEDSFSYNNKEANKYDSIVEKITKQENLNYISMKNLLNIEELEDGLHPNSIGHEKMYEKMRKELLKLSKS